MKTTTSLAKVAEVIATWLNPERKEKAILRAAIESADQLMAIKDELIYRTATGTLKASRKNAREYATFTEKRLLDHEVHHMKRFQAWKDGQT
jgi:hypothetical protein